MRSVPLYHEYKLCILAGLPTSFSLVFNGPFQSSPPRHLCRHPDALLVWHWLSCGFGWNLLPHVIPLPGPAHYNSIFLYSLYISALVFFFFSLNNVCVCVCVCVWSRSSRSTWQGSRLQRPCVNLCACCRLQSASKWSLTFYCELLRWVFLVSAISALISGFQKVGLVQVFLFNLEHFSQALLLSKLAKTKYYPKYLQAWASVLRLISIKS